MPAGQVSSLRRTPPCRAAAHAGRQGLQRHEALQCHAGLRATRPAGNMATQTG